MSGKVGGGAGTPKSCEGIAFRYANGVVKKELEMADESNAVVEQEETPPASAEGEKGETAIVEVIAEIPPRPLGGATSYADADEYEAAREQEGFMCDQSQTFRIIFDNIWADETMSAADKATAVETAVQEFARRVKAGPQESKGLLQRIKETIWPSDEKAVWTAAFINDLPDSSFAYIEPGGKKDPQGRTVPRSLRHFPFKDASGKVDLPHLRNALARAPQSPFGTQAMPKLRAAAAAAGVGKFAKGMLGSFQAFKDMAGNWRWLSITTNKYRDLEGEIFSEKAHEEYIARTDKMRDHPELWLWHVPGSRVGVADFVTGCGGFVLHSGTFDEGMEGVAESLSRAEELAVSHGYEYKGGDREDGVYDWYQTFEVSPLPVGRAANVYTDFAAEIKEEEAMQITAEKKQFLAEHLGEKRTEELVERLTQISKELEEGGIEFKSLLSVEKPETKPKEETPEEPTSEEKPAEEQPSSEVAGVLGKLQEGLDSLASLVEDQGKAIKELQRTDEEKIKAALSPSQKAPGSDERPSQSDATKASEEEVKDATKDDEPDQSPIAPYAQVLMGKGAVQDGGIVRSQ